MSISAYEELDPIEKWLANVSYANSESKETEKKYRYDFTEFLDFIGKPARTIMEEYHSITDFKDARRFRDQLADYIMKWIVSLRKKGLANITIAGKVCSVKSFLKYNRIRIGYIPTAKGGVEYHNRDITKAEIETIMNVSLPRDRAFYAVMAQSGLRPVTICKLQINHIEYDRLLREESPVKIDVPSKIAKGKYHSYFTFISSEAIHSLKSYLKTRNVTKDSYLFVKAGSKNTPMKPSAVSAQFSKTVRKLREKNELDFELRDNKPSELRLYNLRKFFKKFAYKAGEEFSEFWMGHKVGVQDHYRAQDPEYHRNLYAENAAPDLRIQTNSPGETEKLLTDMNKLKSIVGKKDKEIQQLRKEMKELKENTAELQAFVDMIEEHDLLNRNKILKAVLEQLAEKEEKESE